jgi:hypothetical protein
MTDIVERFRRFVKLVAFGLVVAALIDQLRRDREERTWEGSVAGIVPYDFRMPTLERARSRWWNTDDDRLFVPQVFGVGWTINLARLARLAPPSDPNYGHGGASAPHNTWSLAATAAMRSVRAMKASPPSGAKDGTSGSAMVGV